MLTSLKPGETHASYVHVVGAIKQEPWGGGRYSFPRELAVAAPKATSTSTSTSTTTPNDVTEQLYVYNFGFGANLSPEKMKARGTNPVSATPAKLAHWKLVFNQMGYPPVEPSFANLVKCDGDVVHGVMYQLTLNDFQMVYEGEGNGSWHDTTVVQVQTYSPSSSSPSSLSSSSPPSSSPFHNAVIFTGIKDKLTCDGLGLPPSSRYKALLVDGATAAGLDASYIQRLQAHPSRDASVVLQYMMRERWALLNFTSRLDNSTWMGWALCKANRDYSDVLRWCCVRAYPFPVLRELVPAVLLIPFVLLRPIVEHVFEPLYAINSNNSNSTSSNSNSTFSKSNSNSNSNFKSTSSNCSPPPVLSDKRD